MDLRVALRHAMSRNALDQIRSSELTVNLVGTIEIHDEGPRRRRIGPVRMSSQVAEPFIRAFVEGDEQLASEEFQYAFASSYGVGDVAVSDVSQLDIAPS